jgi:hypothetical protein
MLTHQGKAQLHLGVAGSGDNMVVKRRKAKLPLISKRSLGGRADASHGMTRTSRFILCTSRFITLMKLGKIGPALLHVCVSVSAL